MTYLLDTNVVSEIRKAKTGRADPNVVAWARRVASPRLFLSVISILEIEIGILRLARRDEPQAAILGTWLNDHVLPSFEGRILVIDTVVARRCAGLHVPDPPSERDALIAATAIVHGLTVVTRNTADFESLGVSLHDPWN